MPSQKTRSKEDTWTPDELNKAMNKTGERRHHRDRDDNKLRDRAGRDEKHRRRKDEEPERRHHRDDDDRRHRRRDEDDGVNLTEDEREKLRQERRDKREGKDRKDRKPRDEIQFNTKADDREIELNDVNQADDRRRSHHGDRDRRHRDDRNRESGRDKRHRDEESDRDRDRRRRHKEEEDEEDEREKRRRERRKEKEEEDRRKRPEEKKDRRRDDDRDRRKDRDDRSDRHRDRKEKDRDKDRDGDRDRRRREDGRKETEREKEERREREREERRREKEEKKKKEKEEEKEEEDEYNYEEDFEDYEEDFEDDDEDEDDNAGNHVQGSIQKERRAGTRLEYNDSEVNDVLKALDAENSRLIRESSDSPQVQRNYARDRRQNDDDEDSDDQVDHSYQPRQDRPKTAINFVSAKQRAMSRKTASKTMQRSHDLLKMIELDVINFDILDMPPVNEYDLYIRAFGSSNTRQAYVQTNDDNIDREVQTEEVDVRQKWTQYPSETHKGCGRGDGEKDIEEEEESQMKQNRDEDLGRLNKFLEKAGQVVAMLLEEDKEQQGGESGHSRSQISISDSYTQIDLLPILEGRHVVHSHFSPVQPNLLLTAYSSAPEITAENSLSRKGIICVWNTNDSSYPQKILVCSSQPRCCCFSPVKPSLAFAGMVDGSIAVWDLREPPSLHRPTVVKEEEYCLRYPTYDTAGVLTEENHHTPVCSISPIYSYINSPLPNAPQSQAADDSSGLSFQLVSIEDSAVLHFWVVAELGASDFAGSQNDLGLAPGGKVKILKSSTLTLENPSRDVMMKGQVKALDLKFPPSDPNQFYVSTDSGIVIHGVRFGTRAFPRAHAPVIETIVDVVSVDFSPFEMPCFLAGCSDGSFSLYHTRSEHPLITWPQVTHGKPVLRVMWSRSRPCVFFVLDVASTLYIFDLLDGDLGPKQVETISKERVVSFSLTNDHKATGLGIPGKEPQMLFSLESGRTEIHTISKSLREPDQLETDFLGSYLQRF